MFDLDGFIKVARCDCCGVELGPMLYEGKPKLIELLIKSGWAVDEDTDRTICGECVAEGVKL